LTKAFEKQRQPPDISDLAFEERLDLTVDRETAQSETKRLVTQIKFASLRPNES
jgi:hypothetical protein